MSETVSAPAAPKMRKGRLRAARARVFRALGRPPSPSAELPEPKFFQDDLLQIASEQFKRVLSASDRSRARAQLGFSGSSALVAGLTATGGATGFVHEADWVIALGVAALALWAAAALVFVSAQVAPERETGAGENEKPQAFPIQAYANALRDARTIAQRLWLAELLVVPAVALTGSAVASAEVTSAPAPKPVSALIELNRGGATAIAEMCAARGKDDNIGPNVTALVSKDNIEDSSANQVEVTYDHCGTIRIPRADIAGYSLN
jgi:hypothetical protein